MNKNSVLIATDDLSTVESLKESTIKHDCHMLGVADTKEKVKKWADNKDIDLLFLDLNIDQPLKLLNLAQDLNKEHDIATIVILECSLTTDYDQVKNFGISGVLMKPVKNVKFMNDLLKSKNTQRSKLHVQI